MLLWVTCSSWDGSGCSKVPISQNNENKMSFGVIASKKRQMVWMKKGAGGEGTVWDWVGKARERIGKAVGWVPNAHSEDQSLEPLCAGNTKRLAPCLVDNEPMGVQWQLNFQRARGKRCPSLSVLSNRPKWHKDTLWTCRNWAIHVFTEISWRSIVREPWLKPLSSAGGEWKIITCQLNASTCKFGNFTSYVWQIFWLTIWHKVISNSPCSGTHLLFF